MRRMQRLARLAGLSLAGVALAAVAAAAQPKPAADPRAAIATTLARAFKSPDNWDGKLRELAPGAILVDRDGGVVKDGNLGFHTFGDDAFPTNPEESMQVSQVEAQLDRAPVIVADAAAGTGWFRGTLVYKITNVQVGLDGGTLKLPVSGVVVRDGAGGWKIAALIVTDPLADRDLIARATRRKLALSTAAPKLAGDAALAKEVAGWFATGFTGKGAGGAPRYALGTAPGELGVAAAADKLAASWDKLKLAATAIDARAFGPLAFVRAEVQLPLKKGGGAAPLVLGAIAVREAGSWRWVGLQWATPLVPPYNGFDADVLER